jgi:hypothetical protein
MSDLAIVSSFVTQSELQSALTQYVDPEVRFATVQALLASTTLPRGVNAVWEGGGYRYREAASNATDQHVTTAGGVKLYVLPLASGGYAVKAFGAVGDGVANDTTAVHKCLEVSVNTRAVFADGNYRVTSGYTQSGGNVNIEGTSPQRTVITLDSTAADSFFYSFQSLNRLTVLNMGFRCAQSVFDRRFFLLGTPGANPAFTVVFDHCAFTSVEKPINFVRRSYFQSAHFSNVQFFDSNSIHAEPNIEGDPEINLRGTLLRLDNVYCRGVHPDITGRTVMDLQTVRAISGNNVLIEGPVQAGTNDWTGLRVANPHADNYTRAGHSTFTALHVEVVGTTGRALQIDDGLCIVVNPSSLNCGAIKVKMLTKATLMLQGAMFTDTTASIASFFDLSANARVLLIGCGGRGSVGSAQITEVGHFADLFPSDSRGNSIFSRIGRHVAYEWDGGFLRSDSGVSVASSTTTFPSFDATHGRKINVTAPSGYDLRFAVGFPADMANFDQFIVAMHYRVPNFTNAAGQILLRVGTSVADEIVYRTHTIADVGLEFDFNFIVSRERWAAGTMRFRIVSSTGMGFTEDLQIYALRLGAGNAPFTSTRKRFPPTVTTFNSAAPTLGEWRRGDIVYHTAPSAGGNVGWVCVESGTPGTWQTFGTISS